MDPKFKNYRIISSRRKKDPSILSKEMLIERIRNYGSENLKLTYSMIKVISLTTATIVLLNIIYESWPIFDFDYFFDIKNTFVWHKNNIIFDAKIICWLTSCMLLILTYEAALFATTFLYRLLGKTEVVLMFAYVVLEFFLFATLYPNFFLEKHFVEAVKPTIIGNGEILFPRSLCWWFVIYGLYTLFIGQLGFGAIRRIHRIQFYDKKIAKYLIDIYRTDNIETIVFGTISLLIGLISLKLNYTTKHFYAVLTLLAFSLLILIIWAYKRQFKKRQNILDELLGKRAPILSLKETLHTIRHGLR